MIEWITESRKIFYFVLKPEETQVKRHAVWAEAIE